MQRTPQLFPSSSNIPHNLYYINGEILLRVTVQKILVCISLDLKWENMIYLIRNEFKYNFKLYKIYISPKKELAIPVWNRYFANDRDF